MIRYKLPKMCCVFTAKAIAILKTIELINESGNIHKNNIILTDSLNILKNIDNTTYTKDKSK